MKPAPGSRLPGGPTQTKGLLVADGFDGIEAGRFLGGIPAEEDTGEGADGETHDDRPRLDGDGPVGKGLDGVGGADTQQDTDDATGDAEQDGLDEKLVEDIDATGTDTHAKANLARALGDTDVHDVHDTDATHDEGDAGHAAKEDGKHAGGAVHHIGQLLLGANVEVVLIALGLVGGILEFVGAAQDGGHLVGGLLRDTFHDRRGQDLMEVVLGEDALHDGGVGSEDIVVLVHTHGVVAFLLHHTDDAEGDGVEANDLADGVGTVGEEVIDHRLAEEANFGGRLDLGLGEHLALGDGQLTNLQVVEVGTVDTRRRVVVAVDKLAGTLDEGGDGLDEMALVLEGLVVGELQGLHRGGVLSHTTPHVGSRTDHDHIGSHLRDVALDAVLGALAHGEHRDHRRDADDDAQGGEEGPHLVGRNGAEGYFQKIADIHNMIRLM